ncbi:MAG: Flp pilus assembly complex ATPase component [candidate division Zixibacteria bacterium]|nr:Flp pilus assembly complex ATPase component [candidate division Zixibacteria bacterium]
MIKKLGQLLIESGLISEDQLQAALNNQKKSNKRLGEIVVESGYINEDQLQEIIAEKLNLPKLHLSDLEVDAEIVKLLPAELARRYTVIPIFKMGNILTVVMDDPLNFVATDEIVYLTGMDINRVVATRSEIEVAIDRYYSITDTMGQTMDRIEESSSQFDDAQILDIASNEGISSDMPVVELVNVIVAKAVKTKASDIHLETDDKSFRVRYRVDGLMREVAVLAASIHQPVVSRIKVMSNIDVSEKRLPQDGRFRINYDERQIDFRVSTLPTIFGEKVVIRILDQSNLLIDLAQMGFSKQNYQTWLDAIHRPEGLILITGPTGSGKTSTLYAVLKELNTPEKNIVTVEDPVEYNLRMINQVQINEKAGLVFASALRSIVRQNPDILMVGEIRDLAAAEITIRASMTGHLALSTLHTSDAPVAAGRLIDMGVEPYLVSSAVTAVLAQRLVRVICPNCRIEAQPESALFNDLLERWNRPDIKFYQGQGCPRCNQTGYTGRTAIHELMIVSPELKEMISRKAPHVELRRSAIESGMISLLDDGLTKASNGTTSIEEVLRVCHNEDSKLKKDIKAPVESNVATV